MFKSLAQIGIEHSTYLRLLRVKVGFLQETAYKVDNAFPGVDTVRSIQHKHNVQFI